MAVTEYVPDAVIVGEVILGFCVAVAKLFGPVHAYVAPVTVLAVRVTVVPEQTGVLLLAVGAAGVP